MMRRRYAIAIFVVVLAFFGVFFIWPIATTVRGGLMLDGRFSLEFVAAVFRNPVYVEALLNSLAIAVGTTLLVSLISLPLAWLADRYDFPLKKTLGAMVLVPMILPPFVGAIGMRQILGRYGALNAVLSHLGVLADGEWIDWLGGGRFWGVVLLESLYLYPILYLNATAALANIDPAMNEAAENLGAGGLRKFFRVTLPLMMPGLFAGGTIVFIWSFTELGTPLMLDYTRVTSVQIFNGIKEIGSENPFPYALVVVMLAAALLLYGTSKLLFGRRAHAMIAKATVAATARRVRGLKGALVALPFLVVICAAILPHIGVVLVSISSDWYRSVVPSQYTLDHFAEALGHPMTVGSITNSLKYAGMAVVINLTLGVLIAWVVIRSDLPGRGLLDALAMMPLAVPGLVIAFGYLAMTQQGEALAWLVGDPRDPNPIAILTIAYAVRRMPYVVRSASAGLQQTSVTLEEAAANLGAGAGHTLRRVTLPLISANLLAGGLLAFSFAMLEVSDSLMLAQKVQDYPITKAIFDLFQILGDGRFLASALGVWAMLLLIVTIVGASLLLGRRLGALFRV